MITRLYIRNFGIIREHEISFARGLTVITGETGAGKSIVLGAMGLLMGDRADGGILFDKNEKTVVEGEFNQQSDEMLQWLEAEGFDANLPLLVRREIWPQGKSRAFINDSPATLQQLKTLSSWLMDISGQQESRELYNARFQYDWLDELSGTRAISKDYAKKYLLWQKLKGRLHALQENENTRLQQLDLERYMLEELAQARIQQADELTTLEQQLEIQENALQIRQVLEGMSYQLQEADQALVTQLRQLCNSLLPFRKLHDELGKVFDTLQNTQVELIELGRDLNRLSGGFETDEALTQQLRSRVDLLNKLLNKHRLSSLEALMTRESDLAASVERLEQAGTNADQLETEITSLEVDLNCLADEISRQRTQTLPQLHAQLDKLLPAVGLVYAKLEIQLEVTPELLGARQGRDRLRMLFSANQGSVATDLHKVASGGELSRVMLCLKSLLHRRAQLPTVVFDEIDAGISGETALQVGKVIRSLADEHQVILITHLPQMAARGDVHLFVSKKNEAGRTVSRVDVLDNEARTEAIARMIAGDEAGETALQQARELLHK
jgi:DNA repair protein RecN (Recombination protein N)